MFKTLLGCLTLVSLLYMLFFLASKSENWNSYGSSSFECGFTSYFFSRFSFSIHYFMVGMIFLFLDLEICLALPFLNGTFDTIVLLNIMMIFLTALLAGLLYEWVQGNLEWKF